MRHLSVAAVAAGLLLAGCGGDEVASPTDTPPSAIGTSPAVSDPSPGSIDDVRLGVEIVAEGLASPVFVTPLLGTPDLLVLEQAGRVQRIAADGQVTPWLDLTDRVGSGGNEQGLLGLALHPSFPEVGRVFVHYTDRDGATTLDQLAATAQGADPASRVNLLAIPQPASNHNGGMLAFHDGLLYLGLGDGGASGDRFGNGQDPFTLLGTILRIGIDVDVDADGGEPYAIPPGNPFADRQAGAAEVFVYGLRNPWRFSFDGDRLFIGDVGQNSWEEVDVVHLVQDAGANLGWPITEGRHCFDPVEGCDTDGLTLPAIEYPLDGGTCAVLGGYVYRGAVLPALDGHYFYSDHCAGFLRSFRYADGQAVDQRDWTDQVGALAGITSFGLDAGGELLFTTREGGRVVRLEPNGS
ncbi:MAG TPA: PQQ-dependent sugar dehydrogenase [Nitriliruptorales bacterium]